MSGQREEHILRLCESRLLMSILRPKKKENGGIKNVYNEKLSNSHTSPNISKESSQRGHEPDL
jgi:hypothetical protein